MGGAECEGEGDEVCGEAGVCVEVVDGVLVSEAGVRCMWISGITVSFVLKVINLYIFLKNYLVICFVWRGWSVCGGGG